MRKKRLETAEERRQRQQSFARGGIYLISAIVVLFVLAYFIPEVLGVDLGAMMRGTDVVATLRIILGAFLLLVLTLSIARAVRMFTLEGENWKRGLRNAAATHLFSRDASSIFLLLFGGVALIVWGVLDLL